MPGDRARHQPSRVTSLSYTNLAPSYGALEGWPCRLVAMKGGEHGNYWGTADKGTFWPSDGLSAFDPGCVKTHR